MKKLFEMPTEELFLINYPCGCGETHEFVTPPITTKLPLDEIGRILSAGHVLIVSADDVDQTTVDLLEDGLIARGYRVSRQSALPFAAGWDARQVDDDVRLIIAYGGSSLIEFAKVVAYTLDVPLVACPMGFDYAPVLQGLARIKSNGMMYEFKGRRPDLVFVDYDGMMRSGEEVIAAAYGRIFATLLGAYDYCFSGKVYGTPFCNELFTAVVKAVARVVKQDGDVRSPYSVRLLSDTALRLAIFSQIAGNIPGGEQQLASTIDRFLSVRTRDKRLFGENLMISAVALSGLYVAFLQRGKTAISVPPSRCRSVVGMRKTLLVPDALSLAFARGFDRANKVAEFRLCVYAEELLEMAKRVRALIVEGLGVVRRVYSDAGFFMKYYLGVDELLELIFLAPDYDPRPSLLTYAKDQGVLEKFDARTLA